jgi:hypothetical protein
VVWLNNIRFKRKKIDKGNDHLRSLHKLYQVLLDSLCTNKVQKL